MLDGSSTSIEGIVPFTHQMAVDGREYRFSVVQGMPRFVEMTAQACPMPDLWRWIDRGRQPASWNRKMGTQAPDFVAD